MSTECRGYHKSAYLWSLKVLTLVETPLVLLAVALIAFRSPPSTSRFKRLLIAQLLWILATQLTICDLLQMVFYVPVAGIVFCGPLSRLLAGDVQQCIAFGLFGGLLASSVALFEYRHHLVAPRQSLLSFSSRTRIVWFLLRFCLCAGIGLPHVVFMSDPVVTFAEWQMKFPCALMNIDWASDAPFFLLLDDFKKCSYIVFGVSLPFVGELLFYVFNTFRLLNSQDLTNLSQRTKNLQKSFLRILILQELAPVLIAYPPPVIYFFTATFSGYMNIDLNNVFTLVLMSHGTLAAVVIILVNRPFRQTLALFCCPRFLFSRVEKSVQNKSIHSMSNKTDVKKVACAVNGSRNRAAFPRVT